MSGTTAKIDCVLWALWALAPAAALGNDGVSLVQGTITKESSAPAQVRTADGHSVPLASLPAAAPAAGSRSPLPNFPFQLHWDQSEFLLAGAPVIGKERVEFASPLGTRRIPLFALERVFATGGGGGGRVHLEEPWTVLGDTWQPRGGLALSRVRFLSPPSSLTLDRPGQSARHAFSPPVEAGELRLSFYDPGGIVPGARWSVTFEFAAAEPLEITWEGGWDRPSQKVKMPSALPLASVGAPRKTGWHVLRMVFSPTRLLVLLDDAALVSGYERGLESPLAALRFNVEATVARAAAPSLPAPGVWIDDIVVSSEPTPIPQRLREPSRITLIDARGDAWLGDQVTSTEELVELGQVGSGAAYRRAWREVRELTMADPDPFSDPPGGNVERGMVSTWVGEIGTLKFLGGNLVAELRAADEANWTLGHPLLGECMVPIDQVVAWHPRVVGRRTLIFPGAFHLGAKLVSPFPRPLPDGETLKIPFDHPEPIREGIGAAVTLWVMGMEGTGPLSPFSSRIRAGELASELWLNDTRVDTLNRFLALRTDELVELRVPLSANLLRAGANLLEVRQTTEARTGARDDALVAGVALEESEAPQFGKGTP